MDVTGRGDALTIADDFCGRETSDSGGSEDTGHNFHLNICDGSIWCHECECNGEDFNKRHCKRLRDDPGVCHSIEHSSAAHFRHGDGVCADRRYRNRINGKLSLSEVDVIRCLREDLDRNG